MQYKACVKRIKGDDSGEAHCTGQYFDYWHCIGRDTCQLTAHLPLSAAAMCADSFKLADDMKTRTHPLCVMLQTSVRRLGYLQP